MRYFYKNLLLASAISLAPPTFAQSNDEATKAYAMGDYARYLEISEQLAERGDVYAQINLAVMYQNGTGVPKDDTKAAEWFRKAAEQGNGTAQESLAYKYKKGTGVPQDDTKAAEWFRKAAEQGYGSAPHNLALMYENGTGVPQDFTKAAEWYRKSAEQGSSESQTNLGVMYDRGEGVYRNPVMAYVLASLAGAKGYELEGYEPGIRLRDHMADKLTDEQLREGQRMASEWKVGTPLPELKDFSTWP